MQKTVVVKDTLSELLKAMDLSIKKISVQEDEYGVIRADLEVEEEDAPLLIGAFGQSLNSLQVILKGLLWKKDLEEKSSIQLDINNYRRKQEERMISMAMEKAEAVRATGMPQLMPVMNGYMRRLIHLRLAQDDFEDLETESTGEEGRRRIQIRKLQVAKSDIQ